MSDFNKQLRAFAYNFDFEEGVDRDWQFHKEHAYRPVGENAKEYPVYSNLMATVLANGHYAKEIAKRMEEAISMAEDGEEVSHDDKVKAVTFGIQMVYGKHLVEITNNHADERNFDLTMSLDGMLFAERTHRAVALGSVATMDIVKHSLDTGMMSSNMLDSIMAKNHIDEGMRDMLDSFTDGDDSELRKQSVVDIIQQSEDEVKDYIANVVKTILTCDNPAETLTKVITGMVTNMQENARVTSRGKIDDIVAPIYQFYRQMISELRNQAPKLKVVSAQADAPKGDTSETGNLAHFKPRREIPENMRPKNLSVLSTEENATVSSSYKVTTLKFPKDE